MPETAAAPASLSLSSDLASNLVRCYGDELCTCRHEIKGLGILYGISLGRGWVRLDDDPDCPRHGIQPKRAVISCPVVPSP